MSAYSRVARWKKLIIAEAEAEGVPPSIVAAIISRETSGLTTFCMPPPIGRPGDNGHGCGPMQVDDRSCGLWCARWKTGQVTFEGSLAKGCQILADKLLHAQLELKDQPPNVQLQAAIAAYNCGLSNVLRSYREGYGFDHYTTAKNYSADVLERAKQFSDWDETAKPAA